MFRSRSDSDSSPKRLKRTGALFVVFMIATVGLSALAVVPDRAAGADSQAWPIRMAPQLGSDHAQTPSAALGMPDYLGDPGAHVSIPNVGEADDSFFRVECSFSHFGYDDPVRYPGQVNAAPLQMFFGNTGTNADSEYWSLIDRGASTCSGGPLDRSAYGLPAVFDANDRALVPSYFVVHYNTHAGEGRNGAIVQPFPEGLRIPAGDPGASLPQDSASPYSQIELSCDTGVRGDGELSIRNQSTFPVCDGGAGGGQASIKMQVRFPFCWDGVNLNSLDQSHMAMPVDGFFSTACPSSHPQLLPSIEYNAFFDIGAGASTSSWRLSSDAGRQGGTTLHGSWWGGWNREVLGRWVSECSNAPGARCAQGLLGERSGLALRRLDPAFGPWNPFTSASAGDLAALCSSLESPDRCGDTPAAAPTPPPPETPTPEAPTPETPAPEGPSPADPGPGGQGSAVAFDTAWELPHRASPAEIVAYLDHLDAAGFDGTWFSLLPFGAAYQATPPELGDQVATQQNGQLMLTPAYRDRVAWIFQEAANRNLKIGMVVAWARANTCKNRVITPQNGASFARSVANDFGSYGSLHYWVLGGDIAASECGGNTLLETSRALASGIRSTGASQPIAFHTGAGVENYLTFNGESWLDVQAVQTGHCQDATTMGAKLARTVQQSAKPVVLAESRYYLLAPPWRGCLHNPGNPVGGAAIAADVEAGKQAGVVAQVFGDARRYQWCKPNTDVVRPADRCASGISSTFGTPGEQAFLAGLGRS